MLWFDYSNMFPVNTTEAVGGICPFFKLISNVFQFFRRRLRDAFILEDSPDAGTNTPDDIRYSRDSNSAGVEQICEGASTGKIPEKERENRYVIKYA